MGRLTETSPPGRARPGGAEDLSDFEFGVADSRAGDVAGLLRAHHEFCLENTLNGQVNALDLDRFSGPAITVYSGRIGGVLVGVAALSELDREHVELKSMHTAGRVRGRGVGRTMLQRLLIAAAERGLRRMSLETGTDDAFGPARALYASSGFEPCKPFGDYTVESAGICMTRLI